MGLWLSFVAFLLFFSFSSSLFFLFYKLSSLFHLFSAHSIFLFTFYNIASFFAFSFSSNVAKLSSLVRSLAHGNNFFSAVGIVTVFVAGTGCTR